MRDESLAVKQMRSAADLCADVMLREKKWPNYLNTLLFN